LPPVTYCLSILYGGATILLQLPDYQTTLNLTGFRNLSGLYTTAFAQPFDYQCFIKAGSTARNPLIINELRRHSQKSDRTHANPPPVTV
jgi:hypothetical protein